MDGSAEGGSAPLDVRLLTAAEVRLAAAVVAGKTNAEIASAFALTAASVESAVTDVCRRLGVSSRTELAVLLGALGDASKATATASGPLRNMSRRSDERAIQRGRTRP